MSNPTSFSQVLLTYPQCDRTKESCLEFLKGLGIQCAIICHEKHHETEGNHLHAWIRFPKKVVSRKFTSYFDWEGVHGDYKRVTCNARSLADVVKYVTKDGDFIEYNCKAADLMRVNAHIKKFGVDIYDKPTEEVLQELGAFQIKSYVQNKAAYELLTYDPSIHWTLKCKGIWLWGDAGVGKTQWAHDFGDYVGGYYQKGPSKYWDGYEGQPCVVMDEARSSALFDSGYINLWADKCPIKGEIKGSTVWLKHKYFIITSNLDPREFCMRGNMFDPVLYEAVCRRFIIKEVRKCDLPKDHPYLDFSADQVWDNPWCNKEDARRGFIEKEDVSSSRDAAETCGSQASDVSQSAAPIEPSSPPASKIAPSMDFQNPFPF